MFKCPQLILTCALSLLLWSSVSHARTSFTVAVLSDLGATQSTELDVRYVEELLTLTENEFDLTIVDYQIDWKTGTFAQQINAIYQDPKVDMLLVLGFAANQIAIRRSQFPKPTFLPFVIESKLIGAPFENGASGKNNLSYLTFSTQFVDSLIALSAVVEYSNLAIIADELVLQTIPSELAEQLRTKANGMQSQLIAHDGQDHNLLDRIGDNVDAVMVGHLPRLPDAQMQRLIDGLITKKLPGFTYLGGNLVERGLLASPINRSIFLYAARRNALNMQAVMLGEPASKLAILVDTKPKLTINQSTAEQIGVVIDFKVLVDADLIGSVIGHNAEQYNLLSLVALTLEENLEIKNEAFNLAIQQNAQDIAKGRLRPQVFADTSLLRRRADTFLVQSGFLPEQSSDVSVNLSQTLFSDSEFANYKIQKLLFGASNEKFRQTQLDIVRVASLAMADVLQAQAETEIQQENLTFTERNLELAIDRVKIGASSSADQYRWETQVANAKSATFGAFTRTLTAQHSINQILNLPIEKAIQIAPLNMQGISIFSPEQLFNLLDNARTFERVYEFGLKQAFERSPEIKRFAALLAAKQRELKTLSRRRWMPDISLTGQITENIDQTTSPMVNANSTQDWNLMINARIPFYQGGQIKSQREKAELELAQLDNQLSQTKLQISQQLLANMNSLLTALFDLNFTKTAATAASRSLSLVTDSYSKGAVPIVDLLNAQNVSVNANLAEIQASIGYFRSSIEMQRVIGVFEFLMTEQQRNNIRQQFISAIKPAKQAVKP